MRSEQIISLEPSCHVRTSDHIITAITNIKTSVPRSQGSLILMSCFANLTSSSSRTHGNWLLALNFTNIYDHNHLLGCGVCFNLLEEVLQISSGSPDPRPFPHPFCSALPALLNFKNTTAFLTITQDKKDHIFILKIVFYFSILFFQTNIL